MNSAIRAKLSVMMFLEYVIYGAWLPLLGLYIGKNYLNFTPIEQAWVFNAFAIASLTGMFFGGQLADRYFAQEKFLAFSHLIGGLAMLGLAYQKTFWPFFGLMLLALLLLRADDVGHQRDRVRQHQGRPEGLRLDPGLGHDRLDRGELAVHLHPDRLGEGAIDGPGGRLRLLARHGAVGTLKTGPAMESALASTFTVAGVASLVLAAFCLTLPHTPPVEGARSSRSLRSRRSSCSRVPSILVLFIVTFLDSLVHYCYFFWTSRSCPTIGLPENWIAPAMSIGQIAEIATMACLGLFLKRLGWRTTMILGILGHVVRFGIYSIGTRTCSGWSSSATSSTALPMRSSSPRSTSTSTRTSPRTCAPAPRACSIC